MFQEFYTYYYENVLAAFYEYRERRIERSFGRSRDVRLAMIATEALFHLREHLPLVAEISRETAEDRCPDYRILADTCHSTKHRVLTKPTTKKRPPIVDKASGIFESTATIFYKDELGEYVHNEKMVHVTLVDGTSRDILEVLTNVANFFECHLKAMAVFADAKVFSYLDPYRFRTRDESSGMQMDLEVNPEVGVTSQMQMLRFNAESGKAGPIDLTGCEIRGRIYRPCFDYDVSITHDESGKTYNVRGVGPLGRIAARLGLLVIRWHVANRATFHFRC